MLGPATIIAIYFIVWWVCLFIVLPFGVRNQVDTGEIVPGSELTQVCTFEVDVLGASLKAQLAVTAPDFQSSNGLTGVLQTSATYENNATGSAITPDSTLLADGDVVKATIKVTLPDTAGNAIQDLSAKLNALCDPGPSRSANIRSDSNGVEATVAPVVDIDAFARRIDFGEVLDIDRDRRILTLRVDPATLPAR